MRVKEFWEIFPLPAKIKLFWDRITLTKTTTVYFVFSTLHCVAQVILQAEVFHINVQTANFLASITVPGSAVDSHVFYVFGDDLRLCDDVPKSFSTSSCEVIWDGMVGNNTLIPTSIVPALLMNTEVDSSPTVVARQISGTSTYSIGNPRYWSQDGGVPGESALNKRTLLGTEAVDVDGTVQAVVNYLERNESAILNEDCLRALGWPVQVLRNTQREDFTFIMFQIWVLGMSIVGILNESVPHTIATLLTHVVATGWAGFRIYGACHPVDLLPTYWQSRSAAEISSLALNAGALIVSVFLSWKLARSFGWQTFKRVGASAIISRIYKIVLILSIVIQLCVFFIVTSVALWLDQLWNGAIGHMATSPLYRPFLIVTLILLPIWLAFGWYSVRQERKVEIVVFLIMCFGYLAGWGAMFDSLTFRWTYMTWAFFAVMTTTSVLLTLLTFILGIICRFNFGKGLPQYLKAHEPLEEGFEPVVVGDPEKAASSTGTNRQTTLDSVTQANQNAALPVRIVSQTVLQQPPSTITRI